MPWKVEWAASWFVCKASYESGGKDHFTRNGSRDYARAIARRVFNIEEPIGDGFEFFTLSGAKMSSSSGVGISALDASRFMPDYLMRYFVYRINPKRHLEFSPEGDAIPRIYDDFDKSKQAYFEDKNSDLGQVIAYALEGKEVPQYTLRFSKVAFLIQMPHIDEEVIAKREKGSDLNEIELKELHTRIDYAKVWLETYANDDQKYTLQESLPKVNLSSDQIAYLKSVSEKLPDTNWDGEEIHHLLHGVKNESSIDPKSAFEALYQIFLNKSSGPQAGWFLASLEKDFVLRRINEALNRSSV